MNMEKWWQNHLRVKNYELPYEHMNVSSVCSGGVARQVASTSTKRAGIGLPKFSFLGYLGCLAFISTDIICHFKTQVWPALRLW